jgi:SAM-dependent methyltransferase
MNLREVVNDIRSRLEPEIVRGSSRRPLDTAFSMLDAEISKLALSYEYLCSIRNTVGRMPPSPNTLRAKGGAVLVRLVRRMLFWYTPQIQLFHNATTAVSENVCSTMETQMAALRRLREEIADLRMEIRTQTAGTVPQVLAPCVSTDTGFDHMLFSIRNKALGPEEQRIAELREHLSRIGGLAPQLPQGPWLDLACGRGDWLTAVRSTGRDAVGVDSNAAAISHCMARGLSVVGADPLEHLRSSADSEFAVITAFHVINSNPVRWYAVELFREAARKLKPEGVFILECSNPASLVASANDLWFDPAVIRPWPLSTAEFMLEYFGLCVVIRRALSAWPENERLPFAELDFIQQLNRQLYGPRAYALFARRPGRPTDVFGSHGQNGIS